MKNRNQIDLIIDFFMLLVLASLAGIGFLIKYGLPPGREQIQSTGSNNELTFYGWDRHQWGDSHYVLAAVSDGVTLGRLRRQYGFSMTQARDRLAAKPEARPVPVNDGALR
ncbi:MAG TPA: hypothetical protein PK843_17265 [bacterium]|nr:hypothetical protein [bacterium]HPN36259.1 hypothetical protein [bacterium]